MARQTLEVADIFRSHGARWRRANAGHVSLDQMKVMSAIERCRTAALGGHVAACADCGHSHIPKPGEPIEMVFRAVRAAVMQETNGQQVPWETMALTGPDSVLGRAE